MSDTTLTRERIGTLAGPFRYESHQELKRKNDELLRIYRDRKLSRDRRNSAEESALRDYLEEVHMILFRDYPDLSDREWSRITLAELRRVHALRAEEEATRVAWLRRTSRRLADQAAERLRPLGEWSQSNKILSGAIQAAVGAAIAAGATYALVSASVPAAATAATLYVVRAAGITVAVRPAVRWALEKIHDAYGSPEEVARRNFEEFHVSQKGDESRELPLREQMKLALMADAEEIERRRRQRTLGYSWLASAVVGGAASAGMHYSGADAALREWLHGDSAPRVRLGDVTVPRGEVEIPPAVDAPVVPPASDALFGADGIVEDVERGEGMIATLYDMQDSIRARIAGLPDSEVPESIRRFLAENPHTIAEKMGAWVPGDGSLRIYPDDVVRLERGADGALQLSWEPGGERLQNGDALYGPGPETVTLSAGQNGLSYESPIEFEHRNFTHNYPVYDGVSRSTSWGSGGEWGSGSSAMPLQNDGYQPHPVPFSSAAPSGIGSSFEPALSEPQAWQGEGGPDLSATESHSYDVSGIEPQLLEEFGNLGNVDRVVVDGVHTYSVADMDGEWSSYRLPAGPHTLDFGNNRIFDIMATESGVYSAEQLRIWETTVADREVRLLYGGSGDNLADLAEALASRDGVAYAYVGPDGTHILTPSPEIGVVSENVIEESPFRAVRGPLTVDTQVSL